MRKEKAWHDNLFVYSILKTKYKIQMRIRLGTYFYLALGDREADQEIKTENKRLKKENRELKKDNKELDKQLKRFQKAKSEGTKHIGNCKSRYNNSRPLQ